MKTTIASAAFMAALAVAAPTLKKRSDIDGTILNYALTLEHLEAEFYRQGTANYTLEDFAKAGFDGRIFYKNLLEVAADEKTHVTFLTSALKAAGVDPVAACTYNFGVTSPKSFMETASILEGVGVSAYLGAAANITNKDYLTAAGSILTVEARHNAFIRNGLGQSPFPQPFDVPLDFDQVYSLAAPFIVSCPSTNAKLPVKAFPALTLAADTVAPVPQGTTIKFTVAKGCSVPSTVYVAFPLVTGPVFVKASVSGQTVSVKVPSGATGPAGQSYAILTTSDSMLTDDNTIAGPAVVPVLAPYLK
ncbi:hypothetical protein MBLNU459_g0699t1 [Dothideomycetes sp. NU459]